MKEAGISFTLPDFHMLGNLRVKPEKWTIWIIKIMLSQKIGCSTYSQNFKSFGFGNEGGDRQCIQKQKYMAACGQVRDQITSSNQNMKSIRLVESNIAETTVSGGYDRFYIRSTTGKSRSVTVAHGTYADGTEIAVALQTALTTQASDLDVTVTYVDGRLFESGNDFTIDDTDVNATDSMGRSVTSGSSDSIARVAGSDDANFYSTNGNRSSKLSSEAAHQTTRPVHKDSDNFVHGRRLIINAPSLLI
jgi:hypothetical protein